MIVTLVMIPTFFPASRATSADETRFLLCVTSIPITPLLVFSPHAIAVPLAAESVMNEFADRVVYTETKKIRISPLSAIEEERELDAVAYEALLRRIKEGTRPVEKTRHTFPYGERTVEIDVYPEWERSCILEVELPSEEAELSLPPFLTVIREVTGDRSYSNAAMAHNFPEELI